MLGNSADSHKQRKGKNMYSDTEIETSRNWTRSEIQATVDTYIELREKSGFTMPKFKAIEDAAIELGISTYEVCLAIN